MAPSFTMARRALASLGVACAIAAATAHTALAQTPNEPPVLPVVIAVLPSSDGVEASGFQAGDLVDVLVIRSGVTINTTTNLVPAAGVLNMNGPGACWAGTTPDLRAGDIVRYIAHAANGDIHSIDQVHIMPITISAVNQVGPGAVEVHGMGGDLNGAPIDPATALQIRLVGSAPFAVNGKRTLRAGGGNADGTLTYDAANNPSGLKWTARFSGLSSGDVTNALGGEARALWLGSIPANANELTIYQNSAAAIPGPLAGSCTSALEPLDVAPPTAPGTLTSLQSGASTRTLNWSASTDDVAVLGYEIFRDGVQIGATGPLVTTFVDAGVPAGAHAYTVKAFDTASPLGAGANPSARIAAGFGQPWGNRSAASNTVNTTQPDLFAPTAPTTLSVVAGNGKATPAWSGATDNVGVVSYGLYRNNVLVQTIAAPTTAFKDSGLTTGHYNYQVDAVDAAGLRSPRCSAVGVNVIFIPDTTPPTSPGSPAASTNPDLHGRDVLLAWGAATDSMGVTGYEVFRNNVKIATLAPSALGYLDPALATGTYSYRIDAFDASANHSALSAAVTAVVANDPPAVTHELVAHPSRDEIVATGYPAAEGPYLFQVLRGAQVFSSFSINSDPSGQAVVNATGGGCWSGTTPDLRAGDVIRITNAAGIAEQTTLADVTTQFAAGLGGSTVVVHGSARDAAGQPIPLAQIEHRLVTGGGVFAKNASASLRAIPGAGADGSLVYDAPGSTQWTATYTGLSADDVARATGGLTSIGSTLPAAESRLMWLGRSPLAGTEQSVLETGPGVMGGPALALCAAPAEGLVAAAALLPGSLSFGSTCAFPPTASFAQTIEVHNNGAVPMAIHAVYMAGQHASDFTLVSNSHPAALAPGAFFTVDVKFAPSSLGPRRAALCVSSDAANTTALSVIVDGTGVTDVTPPTIPASIVSSQSPDLHGHDANVGWNAASDSVGVTGYTLYRDGVAIATLGPSTLSYHDVGLAVAPHRYTVDAFDARNNHSAPSAVAMVVIPSEPPAPAHVLAAHPNRDWISGTGYPAGQGPYVVTLMRGSTVFTSAPVNADASGLLQVNHAGGGCWLGATPDVRRGDIIRITDASGFADQSTVFELSAGFAAAADSSTIVVHGTARDAAGQPLPIGQLENQLFASSGNFDMNGEATLRASTAPGANGSIAYDAPGSSHWTATYTGLSAADMARAAGGAGAESRAVWLGGSEQTIDETGAGVLGGPALAGCGAAAEGSVPNAALMPVRIDFGRQLSAGGPLGAPQPVFFTNSGSAPLAVGDLRVAGLNPGDFSIVSSDAPAVLAPGAHFTVRVAFAPHALGDRQALLYMTCNAANTTALSAALGGQGWNGHVLGSPGVPKRAIALGSSIEPVTGGTPAQGMVPVRVSWDPAGDATAPSYDLQMSVNGGAFMATPVQPGAATQVTLPLALNAASTGNTYQFRVRTVDGADVSPWIGGERFGLEPVDETNANRVAFSGTWVSQVVAGAYGGSVRTTWGKVGAELLAKDEFGVTGNIALLATMGPQRGKVSVRVDDKDSVIVDLYSPTLQPAAVAFVAPNLESGKKHHLVVHTLGEANPLSHGAQVDLDGFVVLNSAVQSTAVRGRGTGALTSGEEPETPAGLVFSPIYPNPVSSRAMLRFALPQTGAVELDVMDVQGRHITRLADGTYAPGDHAIAWEGRDSAGHRVGSGVYFAVLRFGGQVITHRMIVVP